MLVIRKLAFLYASAMSRCEADKGNELDTVRIVNMWKGLSYFLF